MSENEVKKEPINLYRLKELCKREIMRIGGAYDNTICGYSRKSLKDMTEKPWKYTSRLISVMRFLYFHSGYFRKIIQYYITLVKAECWGIDTEILTQSTSRIKKNILKKDYYNYSKEIMSYDLESELPKILFNVFMYDVYYGFIVETANGKVLYSFEPEDCIITGSVNGMFTFGVRRVCSKEKAERIYPQEVVDIFSRAETENGTLKNGYVEMPFEKTICIKYNDGFDYVYPPFAFIIKEILNIEDFKDIAKTKAENEVYKLLAMKIPTDSNGIPTMSEADVTPYYELALGVLADSIGAIPTPFDVTPIDFDNGVKTNINNVQNAIDELYGEVGIAKSIFSTPTSGSEMKMSIEADAGEVYRILRQISRVINFHCRQKLKNSDDYRFSFKFANITAFNQEDKIDELLKMAQASCPVKTELMAAAGCNPLKMLGNAFVENDIFGLADDWTPMKTSYTQPADSGDEGGRPTMDESEISTITQNTHDNDGNDPDNRV